MSRQHAQAQLQDAARLMQRGLLQAAEQRCREAIGSEHTLAPAHHMLAVILANSGRLTAALTAAHEALALAPSQLQTLSTAAELELHLGQYKDAREHFARAIEAGADTAQMRSRLAVCQQSLGAYGDALENYELALARGGTDPDLYFNLGTVLKHLSRFDAAHKAYTQACECRPDSVDYQFALGVLQVDTAQYAEAVKTLEQVLRLDPQKAEAYGYKGYAHLKLGEHGAALEARGTQLRLDADRPDALAGMAAACVAAGKPLDSIEYCDRLLAIHPGNRSAIADKAIALSALGRREEARWLADTDALVASQQLAVPAGYADIEAFNAAIVAHLQAHPTLNLDCLSVSCHNGFTSDEILVEPLGPLAVLKNQIEHAAARYRSSLNLPPGHPFPAFMPKRWQLSAWCTMLRSQGYQHGHIHATAYLSGVYYLHLPHTLGKDESDRAGWIEFGRAPYWYGDGDQGAIRALKPTPGTLLLFPSYVFHRTIPFAGDDTRITIAFDFQPLA